MRHAFPTFDPGVQAHATLLRGAELAAMWNSAGWAMVLVRPLTDWRLMSTIVASLERRHPVSSSAAR